MTEKTQDVPVSRLRESPDNPRKLFGDMADFTETIRQQGILQPIIARRAEDEELEVVMGHRRFRAAKALGWKTVSVIVREYSKPEALAAMLVENAAREDVTPIELAEGYYKLQTEHGMKPEQIADRVGVKRATVYAALQLLKLPTPIRQAVLQGKLPADAARAIAGVDGERLQLSAFAEAMRLTRPGEKGPTSRVVIKMVQTRFKSIAKKGATKHQREVKEHGEELAIRRLVVPRLLLRAGEDMLRAPNFKDEHLRTMAAAIAATGPDIVREVFQRNGVHPGRLGKVSGSQLRKLVYELVLAPFVALEDGEYSTGARVVAKAHALSLSELERGVKANETAEGLFRA